MESMGSDSIDFLSAGQDLFIANQSSLTLSISVPAHKGFVNFSSCWRQL
jgi:hypothetical protein